MKEPENEETRRDSSVESTVLLGFTFRWCGRGEITAGGPIDAKMQLEAVFRNGGPETIEIENPKTQNVFHFRRSGNGEYVYDHNLPNAKCLPNVEETHANQPRPLNKGTGPSH